MLYPHSFNFLLKNVLAIRIIRNETERRSIGVACVRFLRSFTLWEDFIYSVEEDS